MLMFNFPFEAIFLCTLLDASQAITSTQPLNGVD
jgi:hypothetical protein